MVWGANCVVLRGIALGLAPSFIERIIGVQMNRFALRSRECKVSLFVIQPSVHRPHIRFITRRPCYECVGVWGRSEGGIANLGIVSFCYLGDEKDPFRILLIE